MKKYALLIIFLACFDVNAWENTITHRDISEALANLSSNDLLSTINYELNGKRSIFKCFW